MIQNEESLKKVQGTKAQKNKRNDSFSYTLKSFKNLIDKLERNNWLNEKDIKELKEKHTKLINKYIGLELH